MHSYYYHLKNDLTKVQLGELADRFEALRSAEDLCKLLPHNQAGLIQIAKAPSYHQFYIPKPGGEKRFIENPNPNLKGIQTILNRYLQAVYYRIKPDCAHGFIVSPADEEKPRNIYSNALAHVRGHWFLNLDLKDYFHTVTTAHIQRLFRETFWFPEHLSNLLTALCTHKGRLPMGAPTSPVLSNLVFYFLDGYFIQMAQARDGIFTRYADDLTFSFPSPPPDDFIDHIRLALVKNGFLLNEKKVRMQGRLETPEITGLVIGNGHRPTLSSRFLKTLKKEIAIYHWLVSETVQQRGIFQSWLFDQFRQSIIGQLEFAGFVLGKNDRVYRKLSVKLALG
jgi:RNA-directed DNA polymerase